MATYILIFASAIQFLSILDYIRETLAGRTKPNRVTWFMWATAPLIGTAAALSDGAGWSLLPVFIAGFGPLLIFLASFVNKKSYWKLGRFDYICGLSSILALVLWYITKNPNIAIIFAIISDGLAAVPTLFKMWRHPESETISPYLATLVATIASLFVIEQWMFSEYAFSIYLIVLDIGFVFAFWKDKFIKKNNAS